MILRCVMCELADAGHCEAWKETEEATRRLLGGTTLGFIGGVVRAGVRSLQEYGIN